jgi:hypothetical protein
MAREAPDRRLAKHDIARPMAEVESALVTP